MIIQAIAFYMLSTVAVAAGFMVIASRNPVHSVLFLILAFFNAAGLFVLLGAEFLAMILVVVYVGAVAVLFLFVVMMLDVDFVDLRKGALQHMQLGTLIGVIFFIELIFLIATVNVTPEVSAQGAFPIPGPDERSNIAALGDILYTDYIYLFQASGLILLVAMIGAIVLTLRTREGVKRQVIADQVNRRREEGVELIPVKPGEGIKGT